MLCPVIIRSFRCLCLNLLWSSFSVPIFVRGFFSWSFISVGIDDSKFIRFVVNLCKLPKRILTNNRFSHATPHLESFCWTKNMQSSSGDETIANLTKTAQTLLDFSSYPVMPIAQTFKHEDNSCSWHILCDTFSSDNLLSVVCSERCQKKEKLFSFWFMIFLVFDMYGKRRKYLLGFLKHI